VIRIDVYADIICPWGYIGEHPLHAALQKAPELETDVVLRPFQLDPTAVAPLPVLDYLRRKFGPRAEATRWGSACMRRE